MFQIDRSANRLRKLERTSFSEVGFREREHLQEWLATMPDALCEAMSEGEDGLLIIQKEFDGFDGTRERLDLLALDRAGQLVVIENKLDDSGRDVVWQALKYAAYCSSLKKAEIVGIFQQYLDRQGGGDAAGLICEFLREDTLDEVVLNDGTNQRVVFIAANFRREVTATVLWLREHQIDARCVKVVPYRFGEEIFVDLQQVIPTPEAADYMIRMAEKDSEEKSAKGAQKWSHQMRLEFWEQALEALRAAGLERWQNISPSRESWLSSSTGVSGISLNLSFLRHEIRSELVIARPNEAENKWIFDQLSERRKELSPKVGDYLEWHRMDDKKMSWIGARASFQGYSKENWPKMIGWLVDHYRKMDEAFSEPVRGLAARMKQGGGS
ncbi:MULTISPECIES: DUF4268 domain-containing protein [Salipiger]|jgi:hypothetical protein|uniref:DUF4268 domain-containing protein n=1 Tax=Salipiger profundus TaxID=1229727 RepID=A0A1U7D4Z2_9RHOB|nr:MULTISPECIES: DUF4268 domain-containing protein [Salipiger]APX23209.1 protein of unknown function (DUF4268) [Salipiger profundus]GGA14048.1 hypothetical protein GCM10011326_27760 [Salipiger profundus]SFD50680.1 protein of unknown function [Salipiger profundus]